jgi:hypothetical protein
LTFHLLLPVYINFHKNIHDNAIHMTFHSNQEKYMA